MTSRIVGRYPDRYNVIPTVVNVIPTEAEESLLVERYLDYARYDG